MFEAITAALKRGDEVRLVGFGTFTVSNARLDRRNPRTGEPMQSRNRLSPSSGPEKAEDSVN